MPTKIAIITITRTIVLSDVYNHATGGYLTTIQHRGVDATGREWTWRETLETAPNSPVRHEVGEYQLVDAR